MVRIIKSLTVGLLLCLLSSCGESDEQRHARTKAEKEKLAAEYAAAFKVGVLPTLDCLPIYLLKDSVLYDTTKVDIRLKQFNAQMDCDTALIGGSIQGSVTDLVRAERLRRKGTALTMPIATNAYWLLVTNKRGRLKELSQFSDKMVAMTRYSVTDMLTDIAVERGKTKYPVYRVQINDIPLRLRMLINNEMDAMWLPEPQATAAQLYKHTVLMDSRKEDLQMGVIAFRSKELAGEKRFMEYEEFQKAYDTACRQINRRGVAYYAPLIRKYMNVDDKVIKRLPKITFEPSKKPREKDKAKAQTFLK